MEEEFTAFDKKQGGSYNWPYWLYGVLSMNRSDLAINHFKATKEFNIEILQEYFDYSSSRSENVNKKLHIHAFIEFARFSKLNLKKGLYDHINLSRLDMNQIRNYVLKLAVVSIKMSLMKLYKLFNNEISKKR